MVTGTLFPSALSPLPQTHGETAAEGAAGGTNLMKGACCGRMKTNRQTPTSCSEASSTYLLSRETVFWSSTAQSFWFVVLRRSKDTDKGACLVRRLPITLDSLYMYSNF